MVSPPSVPRALRRVPTTPDARSRVARLARTVVAVLLLAAGLVLVPASAAPTSAAPVVVRDTAPLRVLIDELAPAYVPERGELVIAGTVTNRSDETWTTINLYAVWGGSLGPMRNAAQLAAAAETPYETPVGDRIVYEGTPGKVATLAPGASAPFRVRVPASALPTSGGGVYWLGVHASGQSDTVPRDDVTDGRARTFIPYVPPRVDTPVEVALALPLTRSVTYLGDGSVADTRQWRRTLSPGGRLRDLLDFAAEAAPRPISWLVDPALLDAVARLAEGNPPRSLRRGPDGAPTDDSEASTSATATPEDEADPVADIARAWLTAAAEALRQPGEVLTLPYGNVDVPAALAHAPTLLATARGLSDTALDALDLDPTPVLASPGGFLDAASIAAAGEGTVVLGTDAMFPGPSPAVADVDGTPVTVTSSGAAAGGPGPGPAQTAVNLRQRILAEAAVRALRADQPPLTVVLPTEWGLDGADRFFAGLDVPWLRLVEVTAVPGSTPARAVDPADLHYPELQERRELDEDTFDSITDLVTDAGVLQTVLVGNETVADVVTRQALTAASYSVRNGRSAGRMALARMRGWFADVFDSVHIDVADGITLSSQSGSFLVTLSNDLEETVRVSLRAESDAGIRLSTPRPVEIAAGSRANVLVKATTRTNKVHNVRLYVTDADGVRLGRDVEVPIRTIQVSDVIWVIMGGGLAILFVAIGLRLARRFRAARAQAGTGAP